jgi:hypothetical protein
MSDVLWTENNPIYFKVTSRFTTGDVYVAKPYKAVPCYEIFNHSNPSGDTNHTCWRLDEMEENFNGGIWTRVFVDGK